METSDALRMIVVVLLIAILISLMYLTQSFNEANKQCNMRFNDTLGALHKTQGVWYLDENQEYMCVWIDQDIKDSVEHETCHSQVYSNYKDFCYRG